MKEGFLYVRALYEANERIRVLNFCCQLHKLLPKPELVTIAAVYILRKQM
jgi:hypothetical protein